MQTTTWSSKIFAPIHRIRIKREWIWIFLICLGMRGVISGIGAATVWNKDPQMQPWLTPTTPGNPGLLVTPTNHYQISRAFVSSWYRWDTAWFLKIATSGYDANDATPSFMPLYPLLVRCLQWILGGNSLFSALLSSLIVSSLLSVVGEILFFEVAVLELGSRELAWQAMIYLITFPAAFFFYAGYSESLLLTLILATWLFVRRGHWPLAALTSALALLTRLQGLALMVPMAWQAVAVLAGADVLPPLQEVKAVVAFLGHKSGWRKLAATWKNPIWVAALFPAIALGLYTVGSRWTGITPVISAYSNRLSRPVFPWQGFIEFLGRIKFSEFLPSDYIDLTLFIALIGITVYCLPKIRPALSLYVVALLLMVFSRSYQVLVLAGFMRFVLTLFPFFLGLVKINLNGPVRALIVTFFWISQLLMTWMFISWLWVA
jgi:hypothetical protein